jgi:hypothetical protein
MSDTNQDQRLAIRTPAELAGTKAAEAQLEHDIARARALGIPSNEFEIRLRSVRAAIAEHRETNAASNAGQPLAPGTNELRLQAHNIPSPNPSVASDTNINAASFSDNSGKAPDQKFETAPATNSVSTSVNPGATQTDSDDSSVFEPEAANEMNAARDLWLTGLPPTSAGPLTSTNAFSAPDAEIPALSDPGADVMPVIAAQNQSVQQSSQRIRAAIEQNSALSDSIFNNLLDALQTQQRRLADQAQKISEISGQIKSLKNP